jgi:hypothetical protein
LLPLESMRQFRRNRHETGTTGKEASLKLVSELKPGVGPRIFSAVSALAAILGTAGVVSVASASAASAQVSPSEQWMTSASGTTLTAAGQSMQLNFGTSGVTATDNLVSDSSSGCGPSYPWTQDNTGGPIDLTNGAGNFANIDSFLTPTPPANSDTIGNCMGVSGQVVTHITFSKPVIDPVLHVVNLDGSSLQISTLSGGSIPLTTLSKNNEMGVSGDTINDNPRAADLGGCENNNGTNPTGGCGSLQLDGAITSFEMTNASSGNADGWYWALSFPTIPVTKAFDPTTLPAGGGTSQLTFTLANPASTGQPDLTPLDFTDDLPAGVTLADSTVTNNGSCGSPSVTETGGGALAAGGTSVAASNLTVDAGATCTITVDVTATAAGSYTNGTGNLSSSVGNVIPNADTTLSVAAGTPLIAPIVAAPVAAGVIGIGAGMIVVRRRRRQARP